MAMGVFDGYCALHAPEALQSVDRAECEAFIRECLAPERLAVSIIEPKKV